MTIKLYDVPRDTWVQVVDNKGAVPPDGLSINSGELLHFHHIDGMYSLCTNLEGMYVHLAAWTEVAIVENPEGVSKDST